MTRNQWSGWLCILYCWTKEFQPRSTDFMKTCYILPLKGLLPMACVMVLQIVCFLWCDRHPGFGEVCSTLSVVSPFGLLSFTLRHHHLFRWLSVFFVLASLYGRFSFIAGFMVSLLSWRPGQPRYLALWLPRHWYSGDLGLAFCSPRPFLVDYVANVFYLCSIGDTEPMVWLTMLHLHSIYVTLMTKNKKKI